MLHVKRLSHSAPWRAPASTLFLILASFTVAPNATALEATPSFQIAFDRSVRDAPLTGRVLLVVSRTNEPEVRLQAGAVASPPMFCVGVQQWAPGQSLVVDRKVEGYPAGSLDDVPPGDYYVQALVNVYTEYHRADGHTVWALDQWDGGLGLLQSPGNLYSKVRKVHFGGPAQSPIEIKLTERIAPVSDPVDTDWVKHIKIESKILSHFWGRPIYLGAIVALPRGYSDHTDLKYPVIYDPRNHYLREGPFGFSSENVSEKEEDRKVRIKLGYETGFEFYRAWSGDRFPRMIAVTLINPTPYYDFSSAMNSDNNGPYDDAIMQELIPYIENHFRIIRTPYARVLVGKSSGGRDALGLQLHHPDFFGGAWIFYPWGFNYSNYFGLNIYQAKNAFTVDWTETQGFWNEHEWSPLSRYFVRTTTDKPVYTWRDWVKAEAVLGGESGAGAEFTGSDNALNSPVGEDGNPIPLYDKLTGKIDPEVAKYWSKHDLAYYAETNWPRIGRLLVGKLHFYVGDMDEYYRNLGVHDFEDFLKNTNAPYYAGSFVYGPLKGHGWQPMSNAELVKLIADYISQNAPPGVNPMWKGD